ncbi:MAG TPA: hypothetical protein VG964_02315 [Candidatus Saccharimonadales bacterium]|nr:hypothetical protein [Candidatus Saccharimonadales bacterium]
MKRLITLLAALAVVAPAAALAAAPPAVNPQGNSIALQAHITGNAPKQAPTITTPSSGASFTTLPIKVTGLCSSDYLIEIFKNGVFAGSAKCANGSYSLQIDLFSGKNDLIARAYDALNRSSPDSNKVSVNFSDQVAVAGQQLTLTSAYASRGADPDTELTWPLSISGGTGPYAVSVDWGDGSDAQLLSEQFAGSFNITHTYKFAGSFNVTVKATDAKSDVAFLQLVGIGNGAVNGTTTTKSSGSQSSAGSNAQPAKQVAWAPVIVLGFLVGASFWLGSMHQVASIRARLKRGDPPF